MLILRGSFYNDKFFNICKGSISEIKKTLKEYGVTYEYHTCSTVGECMIFYGCVVEGDIPDFLTEVKIHND